jgi:hypothetical protein
MWDIKIRKKVGSVRVNVYQSMPMLEYHLLSCATNMSRLCNFSRTFWQAYYDATAEGH